MSSRDQDLVYRAKVYDDDLRDLRENIRGVNTELEKTASTGRKTSTARSELAQLSREVRKANEEARAAATSMGALAKSEDRVASSARSATTATRDIGTAAETAAVRGQAAMGRLQSVIRSVQANAGNLGSLLRGAGAGLAASGISQVLPNSGPLGHLQSIGYSTAAGAAFAGPPGAVVGFAVGATTEGIKSSKEGGVPGVRAIQRNPDGSTLFRVTANGKTLFFVRGRNGGFRPARPDEIPPGAEGGPSLEAPAATGLPTGADLGHIGVPRQHLTPSSLIGSRAAAAGPTMQQQIALARAQAAGDTETEARLLRGIRSTLRKQVTDPEQTEQNLLSIYGQIDAINGELESLAKAGKKAKEKRKTKTPAARKAIDPTELPGDIQLALAQAEGTEDQADDLAALRRAQAVLKDRLGKAVKTAAKVALTGAVNDITGQINSILEQEQQDAKQRASDRLDKLQSGRDAGRALIDAREALAHARRIGDPELIKQARRDLEDAQLDRKKLGLEGVTFTTGARTARPAGSARQLDHLTDEQIERMGGPRAARMRLARQGSHAVAAVKQDTNVEVHVYVEGKEIAPVITPKVRAGIRRIGKDNATQRRGRVKGLRGI